MDSSGLDIRWDTSALGRAAALCDETRDGLEEAVAKITGRANALCEGYVTKEFYNREAHELRGNTQAQYGGDVRMERNSYVGIVHPVNYSAMKDNTENNTLLKSIG